VSCGVFCCSCCVFVCVTCFSSYTLAATGMVPQRRSRPPSTHCTSTTPTGIVPRRRTPPLSTCFPPPVLCLKGDRDRYPHTGPPPPPPPPPILCFAGDRDRYPHIDPPPHRYCASKATATAIHTLLEGKRPLRQLSSKPLEDNWHSGGT